MMGVTARLVRRTRAPRNRSHHCTSLAVRSWTIQDVTENSHVEYAFCVSIHVQPELGSTVAHQVFDLGKEFFELMQSCLEFDRRRVVMSISIAMGKNRSCHYGHQIRHHLPTEVTASQDSGRGHDRLELRRTTPKFADEPEPHDRGRLSSRFS